jgi:hypothetical protein
MLDSSLIQDTLHPVYIISDDMTLDSFDCKWFIASFLFETQRNILCTPRTILDYVVSP